MLAGRSNVYIVLKHNCVLMVDTGKANAFRTLQKNLRRQDLDFSDVSHLILTHTHYDHCQSAKRIRDLGACRIVASERSGKYTASGYTTLPKGTRFPTSYVARAGRSIGKKCFGYPAFDSDILIGEDQDLLLEEAGIRVVGSPGHSEDSLSILVDDEIALAGDALFGVFRNSAFPPFADDIVLMIRSWRKLLSTPCNVFLPGHGRPVSRALLESEHNKYAMKYGIKP